MQNKSVYSDRKVTFSIDWTGIELAGCCLNIALIIEGSSPFFVIASLVGFVQGLSKINWRKINSN